ncbi:hypothetical protein BH24ACT15_BH24ACT15_39290 [soil metagenome]
MTPDATQPPGTLDVPRSVRDVLERFLTADFSTVATDGTPITWPVLPTWEPAGEQIVVATSIGLPHKAFNARRHPQVSLLYSDPPGSELANPPTVLVQGDAVVSPDIVVSFDQLQSDVAQAVRDSTIELLRRQPQVGWYISNPISRALMGWYFLRLFITVRPRTVRWGPGTPDGWTVCDVG